MIKAVKIFTNGMMLTRNTVLRIRKLYSNKEPTDEEMDSLIKSQGIIPQINQTPKCRPSAVGPTRSPYVSANHITKMDIPGTMNAQGRPTREAR